MPAINEDHVQQALNGLRHGIFPSIRAAARAYDLTESVLRRRCSGLSTTRSQARATQQLLSPYQEDIVKSWILYCEQCGFAISHPQLREFVIILSTSAGGPSRIDSEWIRRFLSRHPDLKTKIGKKLDVLRTENVTSASLTTWFNTLHGHMKRLRIEPANLYNMDETGIALGVCTNSRVIGTSSTNTALIKRPENREWISIIETISATGKKLRPVVIFKAEKSVQSSWFRPGQVPDWLYTHSENGWTSNTIGLAWLNDVFHPETNTGQNRLLVVDGHGSHLC